MKRHDDMDFLSTGQNCECDVPYNAIVLITDSSCLVHMYVLLKYVLTWSNNATYIQDAEVNSVSAYPCSILRDRREVE